MSSSSFSQTSWPADVHDFEEVAGSKRKKVAFKLNAAAAAKATIAKSNTETRMRNVKSMQNVPPSLLQKTMASNSKLQMRMESSSADRLKQSMGIPDIRQRGGTINQEAITQRFRFLNEGIIAQCRKWERLQERAEALEKHKKTLSELRWKMALSGSSKKSASKLNSQ